MELAGIIMLVYEKDWLMARFINPVFKHPNKKGFRVSFFCLQHKCDAAFCLQHRMVMLAYIEFCLLSHSIAK